jgi:hypothetical protein
MKTTLQLLLFLLITITASAQSSINLKINHLLDGEVFENEMESKNDLGNDFMLDRLEYYISTFSIIHDGGQVTPIEGLYVLVDLSSDLTSTEIELGEFDIENVEGLNFYFGIDEEANHGDPSLWPMDHPLAPKFPSMHWGWAAGYRFIALEGLSGPSIDQELQFHCIGDEFYEELSFPVTMSSADSYTIEIDAEYSKLLSQIDISSGLILHGNLGAIKTLAGNLKGKVFTASEVTSINDSELVTTFDVFPNPVTDRIVSIKVDASGNNNIIKVIDALGRTVLNTKAAVNSIALNDSGLFYISLIDHKGKTLATRKVIVL